MAVMAAKWAGVCRRCGRVIEKGSAMDWAQGSGAVHVSEADCETALAVVPREPQPRRPRRPLRPPQPEDPADRARCVALLAAHPWKPATSAAYRHLPHEYSLRTRWADDAFVWVVEHIRRVGYEQRFIGRVWTYWDGDDACQYWTMGSPVETTGLINRAVRTGAPPRGQLPFLFEHM